MEKRANLYVTPKSADTERIKDFLSSHGVEVDVFDITKDVTAHKHMIEATRGAGGPPVVELGHQLVFGFDPERLEETIQYEFR